MANLTGTCGDNLTFEYDETTRILTIKGTGAMTDYANQSSTPWYGIRSTIHNIILPNGLTHIGDYAFYSVGIQNSTNKTYPFSKPVIVPDTVTSIGKYGLSTSLYWIVVGNGVTELGNNAFYDGNIRWIEFKGNQPTSIGTNVIPAGSNSSGTRETNLVVVSNGWATKELFGTSSNYNFHITHAFGASATWSFDFDTGILNITGSGDLTLSPLSGPSINNTYRCPWSRLGIALKEVIIGEGIASVGNYQFTYCEEVKKFVFPTTLTSLGQYALYECNPCEIEFKGAQPTLAPSSLGNIGNYPVVITPGWGSTDVFNYSVVGGPSYGDTYAVNWLLTTNRTCGDNLYWDMDYGSGTLTISGTGAMYDYTQYNTAPRRPWYTFDDAIKRIVLENGVTSLGTYAFYPSNTSGSGYEWLTEIVWSNTLVSIGNYAFAYHDYLTNVTFPDSLTSIGNYAFNHCEALSEVIFGDGLITIGSNAFSNTAITNVICPPNLQSIGDSAFSNAEIQNIEFNEGLISIGSNIVGGSTLTKLDLPNSLVTIASRAFADSLDVCAITIPPNVTSIGDYAFQNIDTAMLAIVFRGPYPSIGDRAFYSTATNNNRAKRFYFGVDSFGETWDSGRAILMKIDGGWAIISQYVVAYGD